MDSEIKKYIEKQSSPQKEILLRLRKIFLETLPKCKEEMRWGVIAFSNGKFYIVGLKERVHVGFAINGLTKDEIDLFEGSGKTMRHIKIYSVNEIKEKNISKLIRMVNKKAVCKPCKS